jgi:hypothetical protein
MIRSLPAWRQASSLKPSTQRFEAINPGALKACGTGPSPPGMRYSSGDERLWSITKGNRRLDCLAVYLPSGIDLRLMEGTEFRRTELFREASTLKARADEWRKAMFERGWIPVPESDLPGGAVRELSPKVRMV